MRSSTLSATVVACGRHPGAGRKFEATLATRFAPRLAEPRAVIGDIIVMDNLNSHKVAGVREAIEARDAELC